jgi:hypothetical protein
MNKLIEVIEQLYALGILWLGLMVFVFGFMLLGFGLILGIAQLKIFVNKGVMPWYHKIKAYYVTHYFLPMTKSRLRREIEKLEAESYGILDSERVQTDKLMKSEANMAKMQRLRNRLKG